MPKRKRWKLRLESESGGDESESEYDASEFEYNGHADGDALMVLRLHCEGCTATNVAVEKYASLSSRETVEAIAYAFNLDPVLYEYPRNLLRMTAVRVASNDAANDEENIPLDLNGSDFLDPLNRRLREVVFSGSHRITVEFAKKPVIDGRSCREHE